MSLVSTYKVIFIDRLKKANSFIFEVIQISCLHFVCCWLRPFSLNFFYSTLSLARFLRHLLFEIDVSLDFTEVLVDVPGRDAGDLGQLVRKLLNHR